MFHSFRWALTSDNTGKFPVSYDQVETKMENSSEHQFGNRQAFTIPVIANDLRREDAILQMCSALEQLDSIANDVFSRLGKRISENTSKLADINKRVALAEAKINTVKGSKKATKVFSVPKYPSTVEEHKYSAVFASRPDGSTAKKFYTKVSSKYLPLDDKALKEKLQFFNVPVKNSRAFDPANADQEGLGRLPSHIQSVSSLLLFNTTENP